MGGEWTRVTLGGVSDRPQYGAIAKGGNEHAGPLFIRQTDIVSGRIDWNSVPRCDLAAEQVAKYLVHRGDILVSRLGAGVGQAAVVRETNSAVFAGYLVRFQTRAELADARFVSYQLQTQAWRDHVHGFRSGAAQPTLNAQQMGAFAFHLPPLEDQRRIAHILGTLDDKIELNRRTNETLEAMARALYKSWFVDFDPVRAKAEGRAPTGMDAETAKLFPSEVVDSELGPIPKGWRVAPFEQTFAIPLRNGLTKPKAIRGAGVFMINMGELFAHRRLGDVDMDRVPLSADERDKSLVATGDLLFARQSLTLQGAGQCSIVRPARESRTFESHLIRCRISETVGDPWFYFYYLTSRWGFERVGSIVEQVAAAGIRGSDLARLKLLMPPLSVQREFANIVDTFERRVDTALEESRELARVRDALLPRLLSGELSVASAEQATEATA